MRDDLLMKKREKEKLCVLATGLEFYRIEVLSGSPNLAVALID